MIVQAFVPEITKVMACPSKRGEEKKSSQQIGNGGGGKKRHETKEIVKTEKKDHPRFMWAARSYFLRKRDTKRMASDS